MQINDLHQFITTLESRGALARISVETDPLLEISAITDRVCKSPTGGSALLFEQPSGAHFPVATNLFGSLARVCLALGVDDLDQLTEHMSSLLKRISSPDLAILDHQIAALPEFSRYAPRISQDHDPWLVEMETPALTPFPFLQTWPGDGAASGHPRYITLPMVFTEDPLSGRPNCGMYGAQICGATELALRWKAGSGAARHLESYRRLGRPMPVAIALGGAPAAIFSAMFSLPGELDEVTFAGFLRGAALDLCACRNVPLKVPAGCEVLVEGYVDPAETVREGPFGNHTGCYSPATDACLMRITAISHRPDAVIPATVVGPPPMEDCWMARAWESVLLAFLRQLFPGVSGICFPLEWVFHQSGIISLESPSPAMVRETATLLWNTPWFSKARLLIFVDAGVTTSDLSGVAWRAINYCEHGNDYYYDSTGTRLALDATVHRESEPVIECDSGVELRVAKRWKEYGLP